ncbi:CRISPR-associated endonuclease Cas2 [Patescibacteria group bacterium]|nr:CRISPR-associated endonuclease Cas2 [Patescibacteria group bacterium]
MNKGRWDQLLSCDKNSKRVFRYLKEADYLCSLGNDRFQIADEVKINLLKDLIKNRRPDGKLRIIMFDIPEKLKMNRNFFRKHLADLGFNMQQKSVWVSNLPCEDLVRLIVKYHGLAKHVDLFVGEPVPIRNAIAL